MTTEVQLKLNETALKRSLRFAFANHDTCVAELLQNSRRAGATQIRVSYSSQTYKIHFHAARWRDSSGEQFAVMTGAAAADAIERHWRRGRR